MCQTDTVQRKQHVGLKLPELFKCSKLSSVLTDKINMLAFRTDVFLLSQYLTFIHHNSNLVGVVLLYFNMTLNWRCVIITVK